MRVLIVGLNYAPETTGNAPYTAGLAAGLRGKGHDVSVLAGLPHYPMWKIAPGYTGRRIFDEHIDDVAVRRFSHYVPDPPSQRGRMRMELSFGARAAVAKWPEHDVVLCVSPGLLPTAMCVARARWRRRRTPVGVWVQDLYSRGVVETGLMSGRAADLAIDFESKVLRGADGVVAIHDRFKQYLVSDLGVEKDAVEVIRNWTHLKPLGSLDRAAVRRRFGWRDDEVVALHAGNMGAKQGLENVVDTARLAQRRGTSARFVLLGDGNQRSQLKRRGEGISTLQFISPLPDREFREAMAAADVLLVQEKPGVGEMSVPSKMTSYFTTGNPVIAATDSDSITAAEIIASGAGVVVAADNPAALLEQLLALGADPDRARMLGASGQRFCADTLSMGHAINSFDKWISGLSIRPHNSISAKKGMAHK